MVHRWLIGFFLGLGLLAAPPAQEPHQAWVLALDGRGGLVGDLKADELQVKVEGKVRPILEVKTPAQTAEAAQSWVLMFAPIRDTNMRALAFVAAADFLTKVPEGDRVFLVVRGKDSLESLMPGFSQRRGVWAEALAQVPNLLPEGMTGTPRDTLQGAGFNPAFTDVADGAPGQDALLALVAQFRAGAPGWAKGTTDVKGVNLLDRLNFNNPMLVTGMLAGVQRETKALDSFLAQLGGVVGQKHLVVFSRYEADDFCHPVVKRAMTQSFKRERGDSGGPAEAASLATRDMSLLQTHLKARALAAGVTVYSVAGSGQNVMGLFGPVAAATGGFVFPLSSGLDTQFGQGIQVFGSRYLVRWAEEATTGSGSLDISTTRKGVRLIAQTAR